MTKFLTVLLAVLVFACWPFFSLADEVTVTKVGHWGSGPYLDVVVVGNYAYAAAGITGIDILDISNPASPTLVSKYDTSGTAHDVFVNGNFAYVADFAAGLQIIDISNKASPTRVGGYNTSGAASGVFVDGNFAYVADNSGLQIIDISNKASPTRVGGYDASGSASDVFVEGNFAYVAASGLQIIDISNKASPTRVGGYDTGRYAAKGVFVDGNFAYVATSDRSLQTNQEGLQIIDISNKASPTRVGHYSHRSNSRDVFVDGNFAYIANYPGGLQIIDISNKASPTRVGRYNTGGRAQGVFVDGNFAYVADSEVGLQIINISNKASPTRVSGYDTSGYAKGVFVDGNFAYVADANEGLQIIDISNKASPTRVGGYDTSGYAYGVFVDGNFAYVATSGVGLQIIDISNKASPTRVGGYDISGYADGGVFVDGNFAYVATSDRDLQINQEQEGLQIIDISNKVSPTRVGGYDTGGYAESVFVDGNFAYVADGISGLHIIDISNKASPTRVGRYNSSDYGVFVDGNFAYVADGRDGLQIIDISNKASPTRVGGYDTSGPAYGVFVDGNFAYVANTSEGLQIIDISNKASPTRVGGYDTGRYAEGVFVDGNYIYVADDRNGLVILSMSGDPTVTNEPPIYKSGSATPTTINSGETIKFETVWHDPENDFIVGVRVKYCNQGTSNCQTEFLDYIEGSEHPNVRFEKQLKMTEIGTYDYQFFAVDAEPIDNPLHLEEELEWHGGGTFTVVGASNTISGFIRTPEGQGVGNIYLCISGDNSSFVRHCDTRTDATGQFTINELPNGNYILLPYPVPTDEFGTPLNFTPPYQQVVSTGSDISGIDFTAEWINNDHGNFPASATPIAPNSNTEGRLETWVDIDLFRIDIPTNGILTISTTGDADTYGLLLNSQGEQILSDDESGEGQNFNMSDELNAGTYYIRVSSSDENPNDYILKTAFTPLQESSCDPDSGIGCIANYSASEQTATIPCIAAPDIGTFEAIFALVPSNDPILRLALTSLKQVSDDCAGKPSLFLSETLSLYIPEVEIPELGISVDATLEWLNGTEPQEFRLQETAPPEENIPLFEKIKQAIVDKIGENLETSYNKACFGNLNPTSDDRCKWLAFFTLGFDKKGLNLVGTLYIDLDDYFGITGEGRGEGNNKEPWVTIWIDGSIGASLALSIPFTNFGVVAMDIKAYDADPRRRLNFEGVRIGALGTTAKWDDKFGLVIDNIGFSTELASVSLFNFSHNLKRFEIKKSYLNSLIKLSMLIAAALELGLYDADLLINAIVDHVASSMIDVNTKTGMMSIKRGSQIRPFSSSDDGPQSDKQIDGIIHSVIGAHKMGCTPMTAPLLAPEIVTFMGLFQTSALNKVWTVFQNNGNETADYFIEVENEKVPEGWIVRADDQDDDLIPLQFDAKKFNIDSPVPVEKLFKAPWRIGAKSEAPDQADVTFKLYHDTFGSSQPLDEITVTLRKVTTYDGISDPACQPPWW
jgi:hypothetical protein